MSECVEKRCRKGLASSDHFFQDSYSLQRRSLPNCVPLLLVFINIHPLGFDRCDEYRFLRLEGHCRDIRNDINLIHGPFGSGKTVLVSALCELQSARDPGSTTLVSASSDSACDAVVSKFANSKLMNVRAHALSLEREYLLKSYFEK